MVSFLLTSAHPLPSISLENRLDFTFSRFRLENTLDKPITLQRWKGLEIVWFYISVISMRKQNPREEKLFGHSHD